MRNMLLVMAVAVLAVGGAAVHKLHSPLPFRVQTVAAAWTGPVLQPVSDGTPPGRLTICNSAGKPLGICPLKHTSVTADISGYVAEVTVTQQFTNPSAQPVEAVYTFPLPNDAAVDSMTMHIGARLIKGRIMKKEQARQVYEAAKRRGQATALLDQKRPNIFTQSVANIMPGEAVLITISYVNLLKYQDGEYTFVFPMVVGPRYVAGGGYSSPGVRGTPTGQRPTDADQGTKSLVLDADKISPPITPQGTRAGHDISVTVNLDAGIPITNLQSQLHAVDVRRVGPSKCIVSLQDRNTIPNRDFILRYSAAGSDVQEGLLTYAAAPDVEPAGPVGLDGYFTLIVQPPKAPAQDEIAPKEMVFVIDQTGSQAGEPLRKAKETMRYCVRNMNPNDTFQLLGFNTELNPCFSAPVHNTPRNVARALAFLAPLEGNGGTDILKAVDYALRIPDDPTRLRIVCYMTDGYVGNDMQIIDYIKKHRGSARMFPFGIGNGVNRFLIDGMAREGRGEPDYVDLTASGELAAERFYKRISTPLLLNPSINWGELPVDEVYPKQIPDLFSAGPIIVKGRYSQAAQGDVTVSGILRGRPWARTIHVDLPAANPQGTAIRTLWAREKIEDLQSQDWMGAQEGNPNPETTANIQDVALQYGLMSQYTSFVAVEQRVVNAGGRQRTLDVPVEMPDGVSYSGIFGRDAAEVNTRSAYSAAQGLGASASLNVLSEQSAAGRGGGGFGLAGAQAQAQMPMLHTVYRAPVPSRNGLTTDTPGSADNLIDGDAIRAGDSAALKQLAGMAPAAKRQALRSAKLAKAVMDRLIKWEATAALLHTGSARLLEVQIWLNATTRANLAALTAMGFKVTATLIADKLMLGVVDLSKLDAILELPMVRKVELPTISG